MLVPIQPKVWRATGSFHGKGANFSSGMEAGLRCRWCRWCRTVPSPIVEMDAATKALAEAPLADDRTWAARADSSGIALTTLYSWHHGRPLKEEIAQRQQYLTVGDEKALVAFLLLMSSFGPLVCIKYIPTLAFSIARR
jgi:hypothetical protein